MLLIARPFIYNDETRFFELLLLDFSLSLKLFPTFSTGLNVCSRCLLSRTLLQIRRRERINGTREDARASMSRSSTSLKTEY